MLSIMAVLHTLDMLQYGLVLVKALPRDARAGFGQELLDLASELIEVGAPISVVQAQMRHFDPRITLGI